MNTEPRALICNRCGKTIVDYSGVGYDGPADRDDDSCHPLMEWLVLCIECEARTRMKASLELKTGDSPYDVTMLVNGNDILKLLPVSRATLDIEADCNPELMLRIPIDHYVVNVANLNPAKVVAGDITVSQEALRAFIRELQEKLDG